MTNQILSKKEVKNLLHFKSETSLYTLEQKDETFPQKIRIGLPVLAIELMRFTLGLNLAE
jgi:predicted DNA-binding transcriptional regulator AlpA